MVLKHYVINNKNQGEAEVHTGPNSAHTESNTTWVPSATRRWTPHTSQVATFYFPFNQKQH